MFILSFTLLTSSTPLPHWDAGDLVLVFFKEVLKADKHNSDRTERADSVSAPWLPLLLSLITCFGYLLLFNSAPQI